VQPILRVGGTYRFTAFGRLKTDPGAGGTFIRMVMEHRLQGGATGWLRLSGQPVANNTDWVSLDGTFTVAQPMEALALYFESDMVNAEFFVDTIVMTMTVPYTGWVDPTIPLPSPPTAPPVIPTPAPAVPPVPIFESVVARDADTAVTLKDVIDIKVPAGAVTGEAPTITAQVVPAQEAAAIVAVAREHGMTPLSEVVRLDLRDGRFVQSIELTFAFDQDQVGADRIPQLFVYNDRTGRWIYIGGDIGQGRITVRVNRFSKFAVFAVASPPALPDVANHWGERPIRTLAGMGLLRGYNDGTFRPDAAISRAEFVAMLARTLGLEENPDATARFRDAARLGWAAGAIGAAFEAGLISGMPDGSFGAQRNINRAEIAAILERTIFKNYASDKGLAIRPVVFSEKEAIPVWVRGALVTTGRIGLLRGFADGTFRPLRTATRAEVATILYRLFAELPAIMPEETAPPETGPFVPVVVREFNFDDGTTQGWGRRGDISVIVSMDQPHSGGFSVLTRGRGASWNGPAISVLPLLRAGGEYKIVVYGRFRTDPGTGTDLAVTMENRPIGGTTGWRRVASATITDREWTRLEGTFTVAQTMEALTLYVESPNAAAEYYIDSITITRMNP